MRVLWRAGLLHPTQRRRAIYEMSLMCQIQRSLGHTYFNLVYAVITITNISLLIKSIYEFIHSKL